ncbi:hypothetical protein XH97_16755 [Bradyrhizobium sp. CCBAU 53380]|nr:hypothetical protein [Bradyrhizobium sp. CCBAU 53380]
MARGGQPVLAAWRSSRFAPETGRNRRGFPAEGGEIGKPPFGADDAVAAEPSGQMERRVDGASSRAAIGTAGNAAGAGGARLQALLRITTRRFRVDHEGSAPPDAEAARRIGVRDVDGFGRSCLASPSGHRRHGRRIAGTE